ncbi:hypothetical protein QBC35DRAFT_467598 [Podospora australis]|uniref:Uncharacterized protein n=1 Tax=Podospora australis TaxID=1536484 RepID=A0AAN7AEN3_9PEZI|nr:hypothetical protein QBC35DRAFT_467598 [Podospora australis]
MSFNRDISISSIIPNVGLWNYTTPAAVDFNNTLSVFYLGSSDDGIFYITTTNGTNWTSVKNVSTPLRGYDNNGTWYSTSKDGVTWTGQISISGQVGGQGFRPKTAPSAVVYQEKLYLFWSGNGQDGIFFSTFDGKNWKKQDRLKTPGIADYTNGYAVTFNGLLYLFWNGPGNNGTWLMTMDSSGNWSPQASIRDQLKSGIMNFYKSTSPTALVLADSFVLRLFWISTDKSVWYTDYKADTKKWQPAQNLSNDIQISPLMEFSGVCAVTSQLIPYVFTEATDKTLWCAQSLNYELTSDNMLSPATAINYNWSFTVKSTDAVLIDWAKKRCHGEFVVPTGDGNKSIANWLFKNLSDSNAPQFQQVADKIVALFGACMSKPGVAHYIRGKIIDLPSVPNSGVLLVWHLLMDSN